MDDLDPISPLRWISIAICSIFIVHMHVSRISEHTVVVGGNRRCILDFMKDRIVRLTVGALGLCGGVYCGSRRIVAGIRLINYLRIIHVPVLRISNRCIAAYDISLVSPSAFLMLRMNPMSLRILSQSPSRAVAILSMLRFSLLRFQGHGEIEEVTEGNQFPAMEERTTLLNFKDLKWM
eukprot:IDg5871t1